MNGSLELVLRELKLPAFLAHAQPLAIEAERSSWSFTRYLHTLAELELESRWQRRVQRRRKESSLPASKTLTTLQLARLPEPVRRQLPTLCEGHFVESAQNVWPSAYPGGAKPMSFAPWVMRWWSTVIGCSSPRPISWCSACSPPSRRCAWKKNCVSFDGFAAIIVDEISVISSKAVPRWRSSLPSWPNAMNARAFSSVLCGIALRSVVEVHIISVTWQ